MNGLRSTVSAAKPAVQITCESILLAKCPALRFRASGVLAQSNAIIRCLSDQTSLLPPDPVARAKIDQWMFWEANNHEFFVAGCISHMTYLGGVKGTRDPMRVRRGDEALDLMEQHLSGSDWFVGPSITVADIALIAYTRQAEVGGFQLSSRSATRAWIARAEGQLGLHQ
jgi:glutathione S-transferase